LVKKTKKKKHFFFGFFSPPRRPIAAFPNTQQAFEWDGFWHRGENVDHVPHGMCRWDEDDWYSIGEYSHGKLNGHRTLFKPNGTIWMEGDYIDGVPHGHVTWFNEDGSIYEESDYIHGVRQQKPAALPLAP